MADGLRQKYHVQRIGDTNGKHAECRYFVLDPQHDTIARKALAEYAHEAAVVGLDALADDLYAWLSETELVPCKVCNGSGWIAPYAFAPVKTWKNCPCKRRRPCDPLCRCSGGPL